MARTRPDVIPPPFGAIEGTNRYSRARCLTPEDVAHGTRQIVPTIPVLAEGDDVDWSLLDRPAIERRKDQLDADVATVRDMLCLRAGSVIDLDLATERARQIVQVLHAQGRLS